MSSNGIECEDDYREDCRPMDSLELVSNINRIRMTHTSGDNHSIGSSKSSIRSGFSEDRNSMKNHKTDQKSNNSSQRRIVQIKDQYCWDCHKQGVNYSCKTCLRSYHTKCPSLKKSETEPQSCPECIGIMKAEEGTNPSGCMQWLNGNVHKLTELLEYTIVTVRTADRNKSFLEPVSTEEYPQYLQYIVNPMDLSLVEENVKNKTYASTNSFLADIKWIYHNCVVFNSGGNSALISEAKNIIRVAKQECEEIEICPDCYLNYYTLEEETYFAAACDRPHAIVWAKLKGHPFWPAKVVRFNKTKNEVDVRFFGTHDKCWLRPDNCYLMSRNYPLNKKPSKFDQVKFDEAIRDMNSHLDQLEKKFKNLFQFYDKSTVFTVDKLYLTYDQISTPPKEAEHDSEPEVSPIVTIETIEHKKSFKKEIIKKVIHKKQSPKKESHKRVLNSYNGISLKTLKVNIEDESKFDISTHLVNDSGIKSPPIKRKKSSINGSTNSKQKCFSKAINIREELSSSIESDQSYNDSKDGSKMDRSFSSNISFERRSNSKNHFNENRLHPNTSEANDSNHSLKCSPILSQSQTVTVSGKSSEILNLNNLSKTSNNELSDNSNKLIIDSNDSFSPISSSPSPTIVVEVGVGASKPIIKSPQKMKTQSNEELLKKIKSLEFKNRKLEEELSESNSKNTAIEEENDELKKSNEELQNSISEIKKKQWCTNCSKEAILPCCWNTCYCTVECQHQHWPTHSKTCRRRQQQQTRT